MEMQGSRFLAITQRQAWNALNDPEVLKLCIPGCDKVEASGPEQYAVGMAVKIGPVSAKFSGRITLSDIMPPDSYTISFDGQGGVAGFGKGQAKVSLVAHAEGCELNYAVTAQVGGKIAQLGQRLIDGAAKGMAEDFFKRFEAEMERRYPPTTPEAEMTTMAANLDDLLPSGEPEGKGVPPWVWVLGAVVLGGLIYLLR
jgi:carbon monoxide dehydrogenase subunit G